METTSGVKRASSPEPHETVKRRPRESEEWHSAPPEKAAEVAERIGGADRCAVGICRDFVASRWEKLLPWAQKLCAFGDAAKDELWYWEGYKAKPNEPPREQFCRQIRQDFKNFQHELVEEGYSEEDANAVTSSDVADSFCDLVLALLDLMPVAAEGRCFSLRVEINQEGRLKFHDERALTTMRLQVPLHGPGPILAMPSEVNWDVWDAAYGLLNQTEEIDLSAIQEWNRKILCKADGSMSTPEGSLILLKGGESKNRPPLQRFAYPGEVETKLLLTLDQIPEAVKDQTA